MDFNDELPMPLPRKVSFKNPDEGFVNALNNDFIYNLLKDPEPYLKFKHFEYIFLNKLLIF